MFIKRLIGGGELRVRQFGCTWTITVVNESGKGIALNLSLTEAGELARLLTFDDSGGFTEQDTGVIHVNGEQLEKENA